MARLEPLLILFLLLPGIIISSLALSLPTAAAPAAAPMMISTTITLQPDLTGADDAILAASFPTTNFGTSPAINVGEQVSASSLTRSLLRFDVSKIPNDATVTSADLILTLSADYSANTRTYRAYRVLRQWVESQATWNNYSTGNAWQAAGASGASDREASDIGSVQIAHDAALNTAVTFSLTPSAVQDWVDGSLANNGLLLKVDTETDDRWDFYSSDMTVGNVSRRPKLEITYESATTYGTLDQVSSGNVQATNESGTQISDLVTGREYSLVTSGGPVNQGGGESLYDVQLSNDGGATWYTPWEAPWIDFTTTVNTYYLETFFTATTTSIYFRVRDCIACFGNNTGSMNYAVNQGPILVWNVGNYIVDGSLESYPYANIPPWFPWSVSSLFEVTRQSLWSYGGDSSPMCNSNFSVLRTSLGHPSYIEQDFFWYGGAMFITVGLRTQGSSAVDIVLYDPFGAQHTLGGSVTNGANNWKSFNYQRSDDWLGRWKLRITAKSSGAQSFVAVDGVSVGEGWYQPCNYNGTVLTPPGAPSTPLAERSPFAFQTTSGNLIANSDLNKSGSDVSSWSITDSNAQYVPFLGASTGYIALFAGSEKALMTKNWIETLYESPTMPKGFDPNKAAATTSHLFFISYMVTDISQKIMHIENVETGRVYDITDLLVQEPIAEPLPGVIWYRAKFEVSLPPGRYRLDFGFGGPGSGSQIVYLDKVCIGTVDFIVAPSCDLSSQELAQYQLDQNFQQQQITSAQATAIAVSTGTAAAAVTQTQSSLETSTGVAQIYATQTALVASGNSTLQAGATRTQIYAATATPRAALTGTAFVENFHATLTQQVAVTQTQGAQKNATLTAMANAQATNSAASTQQAYSQATLWAQSTANAQLTQQAMGQATLVVQSTATVQYQATVNTYATQSQATQYAAQTQLAAQSNATTQYLATLSAQQVETSSALLTQEANAQATNSAQLTAYPNQQSTLQAQATQIAQQYATMQATLLAQATQQAMQMPPTQPEPAWQANCSRPDNPFNLAWWVDYEVCRVLSWWSWGPNNSQQLQTLEERFANREPAGTIEELRTALSTMQEELSSYDLNGGPANEGPPSPGIFVTPPWSFYVGDPIGFFDAQIASAADYSTYTCTVQLPGAGGAFIKGVCWGLAFLYYWGFLDWVQAAMDLSALLALVIYILVVWFKN